VRVPGGKEKLEEKKGESENKKRILETKGKSVESPDKKN